MIMKFNENELFSLLHNGNTSEARKYMASSIPDTLTKFYSLTNDEQLNNKKLETLKNNCNWFDYPYKQNDPFDMRMIYVDEESVLKSDLPHEAYIWEKKFLEQLLNKMLICSFVDTDYNNLPMWAYYANNHYGYCVRYGIKRKEIFFKVLYSETSAPITSLFLQYKMFCDMETESEGYKKLREIYEYAIQLFLSTKHISWKHENEYRIICPYYKKIGHRISNEIMGLDILDITIGLKCEEKYKQEILQISTVMKIPCYQIYLDNKKFLSRKLIGG